AAIHSPFHPKPLVPQHAATTSLAMTRKATLTQLVSQADAVVRGRVVSVASGWAPHQRLIESHATVAVSYSLLGQATTTITVTTPGGYLADEGLGMVSPHTAAFTAGEEVLLFLRQTTAQWQVINGAGGKFRLRGQEAMSDDLQIVESLDSFLVSVAALCATRTAAQPTVALWGVDRVTTPHQLSALHATAQQTGTAHKWASPHAGATYYVNTNSAQFTSPTAVDELRNAIIAAAATWSDIASADFALHYGGATGATATSYNGVNEILFMHKGATERAAAAEVWYTADQTIVEADIWINDDYQWNVAGTPAANEVDLESALIHEFGHWLILNHTAYPTSVMYPRLATGAIKRTLGDEDIAGISAIYPRR
ncbi:MAG: matrixin family metalloprotease, partial [Caldilineaceae bacterium]|nr:matrixin family metalloprotease [Caldilineaceae bacterium]